MTVFNADYSVLLWSPYLSGYTRPCQGFRKLYEYLDKEGLREEFEPCMGFKSFKNERASMSRIDEAGWGTEVDELKGGNEGFCEEYG